MEKKIFSGNEAVARGAYEAGVKAGVGYPGTPSTEILENLNKYEGVYTEWSINEKVAYEVGFGSAISGTRTLVTMKHVGLNVAADPFFTSAYIGTKAGMVVITADDPSMHSSQNEQDNRNYGRSAHVPVFEPADSQEVLDFTKAAFDFSEKFKTPVLLRLTTRVCHAMGLVETGERVEHDNPVGFERDPQSFVMVPAFARKARVRLEARMKEIRAYVEGYELNKIEYNDKKIGIITSGANYNYVKEMLPDVSVLKLGVVHPLPKQMITEFAATVDELIVVEELDPFIEDQIKGWGIKVKGQELLSRIGEFGPVQILHSIKPESKLPEEISLDVALPPRPPALCPGCPHSFTFNILKDLGVTVSGDIGCYTLGVLPPYNSIDTVVDMGASISVAQGMQISNLMEGHDKAKKIVSVIGDSTFAHSGLTGIVNAAYNKRNSLIIVLDNSTTAMTGMQPNPFSGTTIAGEETEPVNYRLFAEAIGIKGDNFREANAYKKDDLKQTIEEMINSEKLSLLVVRGMCVILKRKLSKKVKG